ncbi:MAG TPA: hypothetical protein PLV01_06090 [Candidatus Kapabacteria bacterium]|nr:hypothetical protein [Candidatus Kapabacteria bacterium]HPU23190.1 hypothetical protein [Candidatus Kapabacteria bacterium]
MKKIGLLFGIDTNFPLDVQHYINSKQSSEFICEEIKIGILRNNDFYDYDVIFDRISEFVPFYRSFLKTLKLHGKKVISNCLTTCYDDYFFQSQVANNLGLKTPKTCLIPTKWLPKNTTPEAMRNLEYPLDWDKMFDYVGFPAILKSNAYDEKRYDFKVYNKTEFFSAYELTGSNLMILQESIEYDEYVRCFAVGKKYMKIVKYNPTNPLHLRYSRSAPRIDENIEQKIKDACQKLLGNLENHFNAVEFAIKDGEIFCMDFNRPISKLERFILGDELYDWLVEKIGDYLIELATGN